MARAVSGVQNFSFGTINQSTNKQTCTFRFYCSSSEAVDYRIRTQWGWGYSSSPSVSNYDVVVGGPPINYTFWRNDPSFSADCDDNVYTRVYGATDDAELDQTWSDAKNGSHGKTYASAPTLDDEPTLDNLQTFSIRVNNALGDEFIPSTKDSTVTLYIQYKKTSDGTWTTGAALKSSQSGYTSRNCGSTTVSGLDPDTSYDFRYRLDRSATSNPTTDYYSSSSSASTLPDVPEVTTNPATGVNAGVSGVSNDGGATLNATVDRNNKTDLEWRFAYDTTPTGGVYGNTTAWTASTTEPEEVQSVIGSLSESTEYGYRVEVRWDSGVETDEGSEVTFTVPVDPAAEAKDEAHMFVYEYDAIQGEDKNIYFSYRDVASSSSDRFLTTAPATLHGAADGNGDVLIYIDGVLKATNSGKPDNNITQVGSTSVYKLVLDGSSELTGEDVMVQFVDQNGPAFRDFSVHVRTLMKTSQFDADASGLTNQSGIVATGVGTGHGIEAIAGATGQDISGVLGQMVARTATSGNAGAPTGTEFELDAGANTTNDYYNGLTVLLTSSTGAGQARTIIDYDGTSKIATLDEAWAVAPLYGTTKYVLFHGARTWTSAPAAELASIPSATASYGDKLQFLFQRFAFKIDQTATLQTWYKSNGSTTLGSRSVADNGTTQTVGALS